MQKGIQTRLQGHGLSLDAYGTIVSVELTGRWVAAPVWEIKVCQGDEVQLKLHNCRNFF